jgi:hypothetical protein
MKYPQYTLFAEEVLPDDEIDDLFSQLPVLEPPESLVERILDTVSRLPRPQFIFPTPWDTLDGLIVRHDTSEPS